MGESRITPSGIINDAVSMIGKMNDSSFPIDVFPNKIRNIILNMYEYLAFPIDYTACSMMTAISTCIGNTTYPSFQNGIGYQVYHIYGSCRKTGCQQKPSFENGLRTSVQI